MYPKRVSRVRISLSPQGDGTAAGCESNRLFLVSGPSKACFRKGPEPETDKRPLAAAAVPLPCKDHPGGHRDSDGPRPAESRPLLPVGWKSLIHSKLRLVDHANSTGLFLVTLLLSVTSILRSGLVLLSDLFFNKTTSSSDSSWSCLGHLTGESTLFI